MHNNENGKMCGHPEKLSPPRFEDQPFLRYLVGFLSRSGPIEVAFKHWNTDFFDCDDIGFLEQMQGAQFSWFSPGAARIFGMSQQVGRVSDNVFLEMVDPHDREMVKQRRNISLRFSWKSNEIEYSVNVCNGERKLIREKIAYIRNPQKDTFRVIEIVQDITYNADPSPYCFYQLNSLQQTLDSSNAGIWVLDIISGQIFWDAGVERLFELDTGCFHGSLAEWFKTVDPADLPRTVREVYTSVVGRGNFSVSYRVNLKNGNQTFNTFGYLLRDVKKNHSFCIGVCHRGDLFDVNNDRYNNSIKCTSESFFRWLKRYFGKTENKTRISEILGGILALARESCEISSFENLPDGARARTEIPLFSAYKEKRSFYRFVHYRTLFKTT